MYKLLITLLIAAPLIAHANMADELVYKADQYRQSADNLKVTSLIKLYKNDKLDKERLYDVYIKPDRKSLVISQSPSEKGQRVLMIDDKFWMLLPKTKRPIRITPMQKLLGEASTGDIATMRWHEDYSAEFIAPYETSGTGYNELKLTAKRKGVTYENIELSLAPETSIPIQAKLYLISGKLAKIAYFEVTEIDGEQQVGKMILKDEIQKNRRTEIEYIARAHHSLSDKYYNPTYLARNPSLLIR
ncbi:MAG TPA: outer membrane lipoprotein-sorting protein [Gammaproteobacteria bacterium]|nr:outer membrane lipoprotein-sorting protein [Gammaproteobacteria bacterium]